MRATQKPSLSSITLSVALIRKQVNSTSELSLADKISVTVTEV